MNVRPFLLMLAAMSVAAPAFEASAAYPESPIKLIVAYGQGGSTDVSARMLAPYIAKYLGGGAVVEVENKTGGGGEVGFALTADSPKDGYTIGFINAPPIVAIPIERDARYKLSGLAPLAKIVDDQSVVVVHKESGITSVKDLVAAAQASPGKIACGSTGIGSDDHLAMLELQRQSKVRFTHVPLAGSKENIEAIAGQKIKCSFLNVSEALAGLKEGKPLHVVGVMAPDRLPEMPDTPTFKEQGFSINMAAQRGIAAPAGLPAEIQAKLADAVLKAANDPEFQAKAKEAFLPLNIKGAEEYGRELKAAEETFRGLWAESPWSK